ncbi:uncharacterized protein ACNLHF_001240 [Anomaloglossus baeobatrachus]
MYRIFSGLQLSPLHVRLVCGHFLLYMLKAITALNSAADGQILGSWRAAGNLFHWNTCTRIPSSQRKSNLLLDFILWKILYHKLFLVVLLPSCSIIFFSSETALLWSDYT